MRIGRIVVVGAFGVAASACASLWSFQDFEVGDGADASDDVSFRPDVHVDEPDAGHLADADARDANDAGAADALDASARDAADARDANDANDAAETGDAPDAGTLLCASGSHACSGACSSNFSPNSCGPSSCDPCVLPLFGLQVLCNGTACVGSCTSSLTLCDGGSSAGQCVDTTSDPAHCGGCGTVCRPPGAGGVATCTGSPPRCGIACDAGTPCPALNPTACVDTSSDIRNCGGCGVVCPAADGGPAASCVDGGCQ